MAIHGEIKINGAPVAHWEARRIETGPDGVHVYEWEVHEAAGLRSHGELSHRYSEGAVVLAAKILSASKINHDASDI